jgi:hypothetical protein
LNTQGPLAGGSADFPPGPALIQAVAVYLLALLSLLPGLLLGSIVLVPWYFIALMFFAQKRPDRLFLLFVIWNFLNRGAYHYGLLGPGENDFLIRTFNVYLLLLIGGVYLRGKLDYHPDLLRYQRIGLILSGIAFASALANGVGIWIFVEYYLIYFRWLIFAVLLWNLPLPVRFYRELIQLIIGIVAFNSILGMVQQFLLPLQVTPAGYVPDVLDVASGLFGVTYSQHLTVLCMAFASYYIFRFLQSGRGRDVLMALIMLVQPFSASSKFALFMSGVLFLGSLALLYARRIGRVSLKSLVPKLGLVALIGTTGIQVYNYTNREDFGSAFDPLEDYLQSATSLEDIQKLMGYAIAIEEIAPGGRFGQSLGVGPTRFLNTLGGEPTEYSSALRIGDEAGDLSSLHKQNTEVVAAIGELGLAGALALLCLMGSILIGTLKRLKLMAMPSGFAFVLFEVQFIAAVILLTFYLQGWAVAFYYIPLTAFMAYDRKCL